MERFEAEKTKMAGLQDANETMKSKLDRLQIARKINSILNSCIGKIYFQVYKQLDSQLH